jgi:hypothetical protein
VDLKSICLFLGKKCETGQEVFDGINEVLGPGTIGYSTVTEDLRLARFTNIPAHGVSTYRPGIVDAAILKALSDAPFSSVHELAKATTASAAGANAGVASQSRPLTLYSELRSIKARRLPQLSPVVKKIFDLNLDLKP